MEPLVAEIERSFAELERQLGDPELSELGVAERGDGEPHRQAVEHDPHRVEVLEVRGRDRRHPDATLGLGLQKALRLKKPHRLA